jgi:hypothetical protein
MGICTFLLLWSGTRLAVWYVHGRRTRPESEAKEDFGVLLTAVLTLLGLIIGFTLSMATTRYDQRKNFEEGEANAIGTEYVRADLLPPEQAAAVRGLLKQYTAERILYYGAHTRSELEAIAAKRSLLQERLWAAVLPSASANPTPVTALVVSGMNDVLNSQGYTHAAWLNRIPLEAWVLLVLIALLANVMLVYNARTLQRRSPLLLILPLVVSVAFTLIADIDSPRGGLIRVTAPNLRIVLNQMP